MQIGVETKQQAAKDARVLAEMKSAGFWQCFVRYYLSFLMDSHLTFLPCTSNETDSCHRYHQWWSHFIQIPVQ